VRYYRSRNTSERSSSSRVLYKQRYSRRSLVGYELCGSHVSGLAALIVSRIGPGQSAQVRAAIENSADDLGKPGNDPFYGRGRINIARALNVP
jgi:subtilisin family serine protease